MPPRAPVTPAGVSSPTTSTCMRPRGLKLQPSAVLISGAPLHAISGAGSAGAGGALGASDETGRSEEHTSELQSLMRISYAVFCLKKKKTQHKILISYAHIK